MTPGILLFHEDIASMRGLMSKEDFADLVFALDDYATDGTEPVDLSAIALLAFRMIVPKLDRNSNKYSASVENGRKGGRPQKPSETQSEKTETQQNLTITQDNLTITQQNPAETSEKPVRNQSETTKTKTKTETETKTVTETITSGGVQRGDASGDAPTPTRAKRFVPPTLDEAKAYAQEKGLKVDVERFTDYYGSIGWVIGNARKPMKDWRLALNNWVRNDQQYQSRAAPPREKVLNAQKFEQRDLGEEDLQTSSEDEIYREILKMRERGGAVEAAGI